MSNGLALIRVALLLLFSVLSASAVLGEGAVTRVVPAPSPDPGSSMRGAKGTFSYLRIDEEGLIKRLKAASGGAGGQVEFRINSTDILKLRNVKIVSNLAENTSFHADVIPDGSAFIGFENGFGGMDVYRGEYHYSIVGKIGGVYSVQKTLDVVFDPGKPEPEILLQPDKIDMGVEDKSWLLAPDKIQERARQSAVVVDAAVVYLNSAKEQYDYAGVKNWQEYKIKLKQKLNNVYYSFSLIPVQFNISYFSLLYRYKDVTSAGDVKDIKTIWHELYGDEEIKFIRNYYSADIFVVISHGLDSNLQAICGWTENIPSRPLPAYSETSFLTVVSASCFENRSFEHEIGHLFGMRHDRYVNKAIGKNQSYYNYGYVLGQKKVYDIMAYNTYCMEVLKVQCSRTRFFSNPDNMSFGIPFGVPVGQADPSNGVAYISSGLAKMSGYRSPK